MRKQIARLAVASLAVSIIFFSCNNIANKNAYGLKTDSICINETAHLFQDTAKPACNLAVNFGYISEALQESVRDSLNSFFQSVCFGGEYANAGPQEAVEAYKQSYINRYRADLEPVYKEQEKEPKGDDASFEAWYSFYKNIDSRVQSLNNDLLVYKYYYNEYTGGAHGLYMTYFYNIDLQSLKPITLDDLFAGDYREELAQMLWNQLMDDNNVKSKQELEEMGYAATADLQPTENFYLAPGGITFYYNVYDFTPYSMGAIQITLPWDAVTGIRNDQFKIKL